MANAFGWIIFNLQTVVETEQTKPKMSVQSIGASGYYPGPQVTKWLLFVWPSWATMRASAGWAGISENYTCSKVSLQVTWVKWGFFIGLWCALECMVWGV